MWHCSWTRIGNCVWKHIIRWNCSWTLTETRVCKVLWLHWRDCLLWYYWWVYTLWIWVKGLLFTVRGSKAGLCEGFWGVCWWWSSHGGGCWHRMGCYYCWIHVRSWRKNISLPISFRNKVNTWQFKIQHYNSKHIAPDAVLFFFLPEKTDMFLISPQKTYHIQPNYRTYPYKQSQAIP